MEPQKYIDKEAIEKLLKESNIEYKIMTHEKIDSMQKGLEYFEKNKPELEDYTFCKNLFLKNKAGGFYLLVLHPSTQSDFKTLCKIFKTKNGNIRNAEEEKMENYLNVKHGSLNPLAILNASEQQRKEIEFHFDAAIKSQYIGIHPMNNDATVFVKLNDVIKLLESKGIKVNITSFEIKEEEKKNEDKKEKNEKPAKKEKKDKKDKKDNKEGDDDISCLGIVAKKEENFSDWYSEVITKSDMIEYYEISGCYILRHWSYEIWEAIQNYLDNCFKNDNVKNVYFPMFVSERVLFKEKEHVEGFCPEVAWVTKSGKSEINPPIAIRPTSETIMYPSFSKWIKSHRDLPLKCNQWTNVVRWEFKNPTPFIRSREFLWQEGHTAHATKEEASEMVEKALDWYRNCYEELLCVPVIKGTKTENEKFPGGYYTTTVETIIPLNGKGVQCATSHHLGQNFSKMFDISFFDKEKKKQLVWQTSWGFTTRSIGVMIMMHSDNSGLVLPPRVAPVQVVIIPILTVKDDSKAILSKGEEIYDSLKKVGIKVYFDDSDVHNPGWKYANWELKGVPIRIEYGQKDLNKNQVTFFLRDTKTKFTVPLTEVVDKVKLNLDEMQKRLLESRKKDLENKKTEADNFNDFLKGMNLGNMVYTPFCNNNECEDNVKIKVKKIATEKAEEDTVGTCKTLCIPHEQ